MIVSNLNKHTNGWFIGDFEPSLLKTNDFEVAVHHYSPTTQCYPHIHKIATEYNCIISGSLIASGKELKTGDIFIYGANEISDVKFLEDTVLVIVKTPSIPNDKYSA